MYVLCTPTERSETLGPLTAEKRPNRFTTITVLCEYSTMVHLSPIISPQPAVAEHLNKPVPNQPKSKPFFSPRFSLVLLILFGCWENADYPWDFLICVLILIGRIQLELFLVDFWLFTGFHVGSTLSPLTFLILFGCWENADSPWFYFFYR